MNDELTQIKNIVKEYDNDRDMPTEDALNKIKDVLEDNKDNNVERIILTKNKLVLLSKLLKEVRALYPKDEGKEIMRYKLKTQRNVVESFNSGIDIDKWINRCKGTIRKHALKQQITENEDDEV